MEETMFVRWVIASMCLVVGCGSEVLVEDGSDDVGSSGGSTASGAGDADDGNGDGLGGPYGTPCSYLHAEASLAAWDETDAGYAPACYSFQYATQDVDVTNNDWDVLYYMDAFHVLTVVDDESVVVDLGEVDLRDLPATIDLSQYPTDDDGLHDRVPALLGHTYWVRTLDGDSRLVAAFTVRALDPQVGVQIEWVRSLSADEMTLPVLCLE
jgi:hypothetical protein